MGLCSNTKKLFRINHHKLFFHDKSFVKEVFEAILIKNHNEVTVNFFCHPFSLSYNRLFRTSFQALCSGAFSQVHMQENSLMRNKALHRPENKTINGCRNHLNFL